MARDRANIRIDIWADQEWRELSVHAQHLYLLLLSHPTLSYAGVADWKPGRLAAMTGGRTRKQIVAAGRELQQKFFIVIDEDSEEVLIRSFIKHDGLLKQPKLVVSMMNAYAAIASCTIREILAFEVQKLRKLEPTLKAWEAKQSQTLLRAKSTDVHTLTLGFTPNADQAQGLPTSTTTSTTTSTKNIVRKKEDVQTAFEQFWILYPRRDGKKNARDIFEKALKTTPLEEILEGVRRYVEFLKTTTQQTAMPATWLKGERWTDEVLATANIPKRTDHHKIPAVGQYGEFDCGLCGNPWPCKSERKRQENPF